MDADNKLESERRDELFGTKRKASSTVAKPQPGEQDDRAALFEKRSETVKKPSSGFKVRQIPDDSDPAGTLDPMTMKRSLKPVIAPIARKISSESSDSLESFIQRTIKEETAAGMEINGRPSRKAIISDEVQLQQESDFPQSSESRNRLSVKTDLELPFKAEESNTGERPYFDET